LLVVSGVLVVPGSSYLVLTLEIQDGVKSDKSKNLMEEPTTID
jgi:hypothetical protein